MSDFAGMDLSQADMTPVDTTGDGIADSVLVDLNHDGVPDTMMSDTNGDGTPDVAIMSHELVDTIAQDENIGEIGLSHNEGRSTVCPKGPVGAVSYLPPDVPSYRISPDVQKFIDDNFGPREDRDFEAESRLLDIQEKERQISHEQWERDTAHACNMTVDQFRAEQAGYNQVFPHNPYAGGYTGDPNIFEKNGDFYRLI